jgi:hypothetical protein
MFIVVNIAWQSTITCGQTIHSVADNSMIGYMHFNFTVPESGLSEEESNVLSVALDVHKILSSENDVYLIIKKAQVPLEKIWGNLNNSGIQMEFATSGNKSEDSINSILLKTFGQKLCSFKIIPDVLFVTITIKDDENIHFIFHTEGYLQKVIHVNNQSEQIGHHIQWNENGKIISEGVLTKPEKLKLFEVKGKGK